jgi:hypothetical protein
MTDRTNRDLAALLTPAPSRGVQFSQGKILAWDREELRNSIEWRGITLTDIPMIEGLNNLTLKVGDIVGLMGWAPENAKGVGTWWIIGKLSNPGEFIADLTFYLGQVRFRTKGDEYDQVYIGSDVFGAPMTIFFYGDADSSKALQIANRNWLSIRDPNNNVILDNDAASGYGLSRPYLNYHLAPTTNAMLNGTVLVPTTTSAAYVPIYEGRPSVWHPRVSYDIGISATGVTDWRILVNGTVVFTGSPSASGDFNIPGWGTTVFPDDVVTFTIEARNTGGGLTRVMVRRFEGKQS